MERATGEQGWPRPNAEPEIPVYEGEEGEAPVGPAPMPDLAKPFAVFGAAAGLFAILAIGAFREAAREVSPLKPMLATAVFGALAGAALARWQGLHRPGLTRDALLLRIGVIAALAGAASGGTVGLVTWGPDGVTRFAVGGAAIGLVFLPSCMVVFEAARRAGRGRHGSLVAATDRRTVVSTVLAGVAFAGAIQVPALLNLQASSELDPIVQASLSLVTALGAAAGIAVLQRRDRKARATLDAFANDAAWLDPVHDDAPAAPLPTGAVDLGIGAERWARTNDANYRASGRSDVLVKGSISDAVAAFDEGVRRRHRSLLVAAASASVVTVSFALRLGVYL